MSTRLAALLCLALVTPAAASRHPDAGDRRVEWLLDQARRSFDDLDLDDAAARLQEVLRVADRGRVSGFLLAQAHLQRGLLLHVRDGDELAVVEAFREALTHDDRAEIAREIRTPTLERLFRAARRSAPALPAIQRAPEPAARSTEDSDGWRDLPSGDSLLADELQPRAARPFTLTLSVGAGAGLITERAVAQQRGSHVSSAGTAFSPFHTLLEVGWWAWRDLAVGAFFRLQPDELTHVEGARAWYRLHRSGSSELLLRAGVGIGSTSHAVVDVEGKPDTTREGPGQWSVGLAWALDLNERLAVVGAGDFVHSVGTSASYDLDLHAGVRHRF